MHIHDGPSLRILMRLVSPRFPGPAASHAGLVLRFLTADVHASARADRRRSADALRAPSVKRE